MDRGADSDDQSLQRISGFSDPQVCSSLPIESVALLDATSSQREFEALLSSCYIPMEIWYIRTIIDKVRLRNLGSEVYYNQASTGSAPLQP